MVQAETAAHHGVVLPKRRAEPRVVFLFRDGVVGQSYPKLGFATLACNRTDDGDMLITSKSCTTQVNFLLQGQIAASMSNIVTTSFSRLPGDVNAMA